MLQVRNQKINPYLTKRNANFGRGADVRSIEMNRMSDEEKAEKMQEFADKISKSNKGPSAVRSFMIISILTAASALTASTVAGRFYNVFNKMGAFSKINQNITKVIEKSTNKVNSMPNQEGFKGNVIKGIKSSLSALNNNSIYGVEEKLAKFNVEKKAKMEKLRRCVVKLNPELKGKKDEITAAVEKTIKNTPELSKFFTENQKNIQEIKGTNLSRKATRLTAGLFAGFGALKEASRDEDKNGIPDCVEYAHAKKDAAQKMTAAILDCAFDTV